MRYFKTAEGLRISRVGLGTWQFGSREWGYGEAYLREQAPLLVNRALDLGINLIDTAEIYGFGASERMVGLALGARRWEAFLATKLFPVLPISPLVQLRAMSSARRLGTDRLDLYQVHRPNPVVGDGTTMKGMRRLLEVGLVTEVGVSNYSLRRWRRAEEALGGSVLSNQVSFSLADRRPERELLPHAVEGGRLIIAHSPLAQGLLAGAYGPGNPPSGRVRALNPLFLPENLSRAGPLLETVREVASGRQVTSAQVALAWLLHRPNVVAIPGARTLEQLEANAAAADLELTDEEDAALTAASDEFEPLSFPRALASRLGRG